MNKRKRAVGSAVFVDHSGRRTRILTISGILAGTLLLALTAVLLGSAFRGIRLDSVQWPADGRGGGGAPEQSEAADVTSPSPSASVRSRRPSAPPERKRSAPASRRPSRPAAEDTPDRPAPSPSRSRTTRPADPGPEDEPADSIGGEQDPEREREPSPSQSETAEASTAPTGSPDPSPGRETESPTQPPAERPGAASGRNT